eukprot:TRINITY_DN35980_c0_g1_i1.p1 TRINITY_DN35980_c0_g1~~TRINITY_DN35980_c0_g1_i1.p1  ORF type:complete len:1608 (+),score=368.15 TRINITY_DN35980_c0_g1_i1:93-4826(+)
MVAAAPPPLRRRPSVSSLVPPPTPPHQLPTPDGSLLPELPGAQLPPLAGAPRPPPSRAPLGGGGKQCARIRCESAAMHALLRTAARATAAHRATQARLRQLANGPLLPPLQGAHPAAHTAACPELQHLPQALPTKAGAAANRAQHTIQGGSAQLAPPGSRSGLHLSLSSLATTGMACCSDTEDEADGLHGAELLAHCVDEAAGRCAAEHVQRYASQRAPPPSNTVRQLGMVLFLRDAASTVAGSRKRRRLRSVALLSPGQQWRRSMLRRMSAASSSPDSPRSPRSPRRRLTFAAAVAAPAAAAAAACSAAVAAAAADEAADAAGAAFADTGGLRLLVWRSDPSRGTRRRCSARLHWARQDAHTVGDLLAAAAPDLGIPAQRLACLVYSTPGGTLWAPPTCGLAAAGVRRGAELALVDSAELLPAICALAAVRGATLARAATLLGSSGAAVALAGAAAAQAAEGGALAAAPVRVACCLAAAAAQRAMLRWRRRVRALAAGAVAGAVAVTEAALPPGIWLKMRVGLAAAPAPVPEPAEESAPAPEAAATAPPAPCGLAEPGSGQVTELALFQPVLVDADCQSEGSDPGSPFAPGGGTEYSFGGVGAAAGHGDRQPYLPGPPAHELPNSLSRAQVGAPPKPKVSPLAAVLAECQSPLGLLDTGSPSFGGVSPRGKSPRGKRGRGASAIRTRSQIKVGFGKLAPGSVPAAPPQRRRSSMVGAQGRRGSLAMEIHDSMQTARVPRGAGCDAATEPPFAYASSTPYQEWLYRREQRGMHAILVAVETYARATGLPRVWHAGDDAAGTAAALTAQGWSVDILGEPAEGQAEPWLLPTRRNITHLIWEAVRRQRAGDTMLVLWQGRGALLDRPEERAVHLMYCSDTVGSDKDPAGRRGSVALSSSPPGAGRRCSLAAAAATGEPALPASLTLDAVLGLCQRSRGAVLCFVDCWPCCGDPGFAALFAPSGAAVAGTPAVPPPSSGARKKKAKEDLPPPLAAVHHVAYRAEQPGGLLSHYLGKALSRNSARLTAQKLTVMELMLFCAQRLAAHSIKGSGEAAETLEGYAAAAAPQGDAEESGERSSSITAETSGEDVSGSFAGTGSSKESMTVPRLRSSVSPRPAPELVPAAAHTVLCSPCDVPKVPGAGWNQVAWFHINAVLTAPYDVASLRVALHPVLRSLMYARKPARAQLGGGAAKPFDPSRIPRLFVVSCSTCSERQPWSDHSRDLLVRGSERDMRKLDKLRRTVGLAAIMEIQSIRRSSYPTALHSAANRIQAVFRARRDWRQVSRERAVLSQWYRERCAVEKQYHEETDEISALIGRSALWLLQGWQEHYRVQFEGWAVEEFKRIAAQRRNDLREIVDAERRRMHEQEEHEGFRLRDAAGCLDVIIGEAVLRLFARQWWLLRLRQINLRHQVEADEYAGRLQLRNQARAIQGMKVDSGVPPRPTRPYPVELDLERKADVGAVSMSVQSMWQFRMEWAGITSSRRVRGLSAAIGMVRLGCSASRAPLLSPSHGPSAAPLLSPSHGPTGVPLDASGMGTVSESGSAAAGSPLRSPGGQELPIPLRKGRPRGTGSFRAPPPEG